MTRQSLQFFLYYVLSPMLLGTGFICSGILHPEWAGWWIGAFAWAWIVWPVGLYRRRFEERRLEEFILKCKEAGEVRRLEALVLSTGPLLVFLLAAFVGVLSSPLILEKGFGMDVEAQLQEIQERNEHQERTEEGSEHQRPPALPSPS